MFSCPNCGETTDNSEMIYCPSCGAEFQSETESEAETKKEGRRGCSGSQATNSNTSSQYRQEVSPQSERESSTRRSTDDRVGSQSNHSSSLSTDSQSTRQDDRRETSRTVSSSDRSSSRSKSTTSTKGSGTPKSKTRSVPSTPDVNGLAWWFGWHPGTPIAILTFVGLLIGWQVDALVIVTPVGLLIGIGIWYWGVKEVNRNYEAFRDAFYARSGKRAVDKLGMNPDEVLGSYDFRSPSGSSPFFLKPTKEYRADHMSLTDVSVTFDEGSVYNMQGLEKNSTGTTREIYYNNIENITTNDEGNVTYLSITTSAGEDLRTATVDQTVSEEAQSHLRSKMSTVRQDRTDSRKSIK